MRRFAVVKLASAEMAEKKLATRAAFGATLAELAEEGVPVVAVDADLTVPPLPRSSPLPRPKTRTSFSTAVSPSRT